MQPTLETEAKAGAKAGGELVTPSVKAEKKFPVMEIFGPTIQGEGLVAGQQTLFIRFGGCDYRCTKCDSLHAVLPELVQQGARYLTAREIYDEIATIANATGVRWVTFSGGNPAMHQLEQLVHFLHVRLHMGIAVETQGTIWAEWLELCDVVTVSPKGPGMGEKFNPAQFKVFMDRLSAHPGFNVKVVIMDQRDIEFAAELNSAYNWLQQQDRLWLSLGNPYPPKSDDSDSGFRWSKLVEHHQIILEDLLQDKRLRNARILPQVHVLLWGNKKGV